ncbi:hypothetical protein GYMLUDRAFT_929694 [Collybiopsis luxurians FD-317 M1]|nr:hypothetical protein GYMLUDRAFT_929694 [Collybiopsis luxurians FD-317 M1]
MVHDTPRSIYCAQQDRRTLGQLTIPTGYSCGITLYIDTYFMPTSSCQLVLEIMIIIHPEIVVDILIQSSIPTNNSEGNVYQGQVDKSIDWSSLNTVKLFTK